MTLFRLLETFPDLLSFLQELSRFNRVFLFDSSAPLISRASVQLAMLVNSNAIASDHALDGIK